MTDSKIKANWVSQHNILINAKYRFNFRVTQLLVIMLSKTEPNDEPNKEYRIDFSEIPSLIENRNTTRLKSALITLKTKEISFIDKDESMVIASWFDVAKYNPKNSYLTFTVSREIHPLLCELNDGNFTSSRLFYLLRFKSEYTIRMYQLLKTKNNFIKSHKFSFIELCDLLDVPKTYRESFKDFNKVILKRVQLEMNDYSDFTFDIELDKNGRRVEDINFLIKDNVPIDGLFNEKRSLVLEFTKALKKQNYSYDRKTKIGIYLDGDEVNGALSFKDGLLMKGETSLTKEESFKAYELLYDHWVKGNILEDFEIKD